jgi:alanyl-tRNA synthetase
MATKKKPAPKPQKITKTAYVMALPLDMPAKEVVEKAKADGIELSEGHVHNIRSAAKKSKVAAKPKVAGTKKPKAAKKATAKKSAKKAAAPKAKAAPAAEPKRSKADFVRSQPADTTANEVVQAAKKVGIKLSSAYVYVIRSSDKKSGKAAPRAQKVTAAKPASKAVAEASSGSEQAFRRLVVALGVERATGLLADVKKRLEQVIAGA